ncbi:GDP-L-fucose synthase [Methylobacterium goesingense]|uniref:GDP-L-fucose synthase n=1 Tax=Methylobacterium goesingense TaxID=243690 RepID=A0ABV2LAX5_9HYPH|nr:GDP-L-fucose synthase [Methylobacterium goesingense]
MIYRLSGKRVWVAGHHGMVGSAIVRRLANEGCDILTADRGDVDLREQSAVRAWMTRHRPDMIFLAAAKVGGIFANDTRPADFLYDNLAIQMNVLEAARQANVAKILLLGSSCIYPKMAAQPIVESALLTGALEPTNEAYAIAKIAGIKLGQAYRRQYGSDIISAMPTNLYGPFDNFDLTSSHVLPALIRKIHEAKRKGGDVLIWGTGDPYREFLHVNDLADACVHLMKSYSSEDIINVGTGEDLKISELAELVAEIIGYNGNFVYDATKPDGTPRKRLDVSRLVQAGWQAKVSLREGITSTYEWFLQNEPAASA